MDIQYYIEEATYENGLLNLRGWIFHGLEFNAVEKMQIVIRSLSGLERRCDLELLDRKDVSEAFSLKYSNVGFKFKGTIKSFVSAKTYLEYSVKEKKKEIDLIEIWGMEKDPLLELLEIEYPEISGFYNIDNIEKIDIKKDKWKETAARKVDVIVPIYNGYEYLDQLFASLYRTKIKMNIIAINDCSSDQRVDAYMKDLCGKRDNIIYLVNQTNLGFVKSVNKGLALAQNDVVLVNTDVEVPEGWLERLMYPIFTDKLVATATPYTNCGTICSFPEIGKDNIIFDNRTLLFVDTLFKNMEPGYAELPTGVGFCMGMSLDAIKEIGFLDEKNFEKGYGEENDWCQRAIKKGYKNVHVENLFVYHKHGGSFTSSEKSRLLKENTKRLLDKHPDCMKDIAKYFDNDINRVYRKYALFQCLMQIGAPTNLIFNHCLGGGANDYLLLKKEKMHQAGEKCIEFMYDAYTGNYRAWITYKDYTLKIFSNTFSKLINKIRLSNINTICINELATYPNIYSILHAILELKYYYNAKLIMLGHDYFSVCPTINLLQNTGYYCGLKCCENNVECLQQNRYISDTGCRDIAEWRDEWKTFLAQCDSITVFSKDSKSILENVYGELGNIEVVPHITNKMLEIRKEYKLTGNLNIGILGVLSDRKGLFIVKGMLNKISREKLPVNVVVIGTSEEDISGKNCIVTGKYTREELPRLMYIYDIDIIFISSIWPETFSYTAEEAIKMHMPVAAFNLGAPAERIGIYDKGLIIDKVDADYALEQIRSFVRHDTEKKVKNIAVLFVIEYESFSSRYRVEHLREYLAYVGIASDLVFIDNVDLKHISKYNAVSVYRCTNKKKIREISNITRKEGIKLFYDIDDFIFDYQKIKYLDFLKTEEYRDYEEYCLKIKECMEYSDVLTTSTETLADEMRKGFSDKEVIVCRNAACLEMQLLSEIAVENDVGKEDKAKVILGYFSGSNTHNKDWLLIEDVVARVMENNSSVDLLLVGALETGDALSGFGHRIKRVPFVDWRQLPKLYRSVDINLMPLESELFHQCKSENKWMEAGLVGIPTIASWNSELGNVMVDKENVIFCRNEDEWYLNMKKLAADYQLRRFIGDNARREVYATHLVTSEWNFKTLVNALDYA